MQIEQALKVRWQACRRQNTKGQIFHLGAGAPDSLLPGNGIIKERA